MESSGASRTRLAFVFIALVLLVGAGIFVVGEGGNRMTAARLEVGKLWSDGVDSPVGTMFYLLYVNVSNVGSSTLHFDSSLLTLASNGSHSYAPASYSVLPLLGKEDILPGHHTSGEVAFLLPLGETPLKLSYDVGGTVSVKSVGVPPISGVANKFDPSVHFQLEGAGTEIGAITEDGLTAWAAISNQSQDAMRFFGGEPGYRNYTFVFFTGQKIYVSFFFYYYKVPGAPDSMTISSVSSDDGYSVSDVLAWETTFGGSVESSTLPITLMGYGSSVDVTLIATVPPGLQEGVLHFTVILT